MKLRIIFKNAEGHTVREFEYGSMPDAVPNVGDKIIVKKCVGTVEHKIYSFDDDCLVITAR